jgi:hypothetical protein
MTNHQYLVEKALVKWPKAKRIAVENATFGIKKMDMAVSMNLGADQAAYNWNTATMNAIHYVIKNYVPETLPGACKIGNRGFILSNVKPAQEELPVAPVKSVANGGVTVYN